MRWALQAREGSEIYVKFQSESMKGTDLSED
jgi:hypothetical protein